MTRKLEGKMETNREVIEQKEYIEKVKQENKSKNLYHSCTG